MATVTTMVMANRTSTPAATDSEPSNSPSTPAVFHDFLAGKAAAFHGGSSFPAASPAGGGASGGGARGPFSSTSDLASERQIGSHFERISSSCYGPRNDLSVAEISNRLVGNKRSNSDSAFMASSSREGFPQMIPESSNMMKMLRSGSSGGERPRISHYDGHHQQMRPVSASSFMLQSTNGTNAANLAKFPINNSCVGQPSSSLAYQSPLSRSRDGSSAPSVLSQMAADEGSRTGNKGSGLLSSIYPIASERNPSAILPSGCKRKPATHHFDPDSSNPSSRRGLTSSSRQMTIIYGGEVHVFDDVHPNKADVIMALAGSSGGSWCTNLPKSSARVTTNDISLPIKENETSIAVDSSIALKYHKLLNVGGNSFHGLSSNNQGGSITITKDAGTSVQAIDSNLEAKQEV